MDKVYKFGGSSLKNITNIKLVTKIIAENKEDDLENLSQQSLPIPKLEQEVGIQFEEKNEEKGIEDHINPSDGKDDEEGRMIDIPFNLFD